MGDLEQPKRCVCGWRGKRRDLTLLTLHPRQGFGVCPRCWRLGIERIPDDEPALGNHPAPGGPR